MPIIPIDAHGVAAHFLDVCHLQRGFEHREGIGGFGLARRGAVRTGATGAAMTVTPFPARANATITWSTPSNLVNLSSTTGNTVTITGNNHTSRAEWVVVKAKAADGYSVMVPVNVEPANLYVVLF